jgi:hypothetical protein
MAWAVGDEDAGAARVAHGRFGDSSRRTAQSLGLAITKPTIMKTYRVMIRIDQMG